jgi:cob(I)alamin adenosyltransferase
MKIYTKTGDAGDTRLAFGVKVRKSDARVESYGIVDELNAAIGVARATGLSAEADELCMAIQSVLFVVGAELACPPEQTDRLKTVPVGPSDIQTLEASIDRFSAQLPALAQFILPGGAPSAAALHFARTVCRRAERQVVALGDQSPVSGAILVYLNRLGDLLFVLARSENQRAEVADVPWIPR